MLQLIPAQQVSLQTLVDIFKSAHIKIDNLQPMDTGGTIKLNIDSQFITVKISTELESIRIHRATEIASKHSIQGVEKIISNAMNQLNTIFMFSKFSLQYIGDTGAFVAEHDTRYSNGLNPEQLVDDCNFFIQVYLGAREEFEQLLR